MNKTEIFPSYSAFIARADKDTNGVSEIFVADNPNYEKQNATNKACWNCSDCSCCSCCSDCYGCSDCFDCSCCSCCSDCYGCSDCFDCSRCSDCSDCYGCSDCSDLKNARPVAASEPNKSWFDVPKIENIHAKILAATKESPEHFDMATWHQSCNTTHCRGGWVVTLAGEKGRALEAASSTLFAAMQIYHASCPQVPVSPVRFFETNEVAMADMKRCAKEEAALQPKAT